MTEAKRETIGQRIQKAKRAVKGYIRKDKEVGTGRYSYKAVTHDAVSAHTRDALMDAGIITWHEVTSYWKSEKVHQTKDGAPVFMCGMVVAVHFACIDAIDEKITIVQYAEGTDTQDKASGKATSYAVKYARLKLFDVETGEDEESRYPDPATPDRLVDETQVTQLLELLTQTDSDPERIQKHYAKAYKRELESLKDLTVAQWNYYMSMLQKVAEKGPSDGQEK